MADVDHDEKRRAAFVGRQGAGVLLGLAASAEHGVVPTCGAARAVSPFPLRPALLLLGRQERRFLLLLDALFRFQHKAPALVQIDAPRRVRPVQVVEQHVAFKDVRIPAVVLDRRLRPRDFQHVAQLGQEQLVIGPLRAAGFGPPRDKFLNRLLVHAGCQGLEETGCEKRDGGQYTKSWREKETSLAAGTRLSRPRQPGSQLSLLLSVQVHRDLACFIHNNLDHVPAGHRELATMASQDPHACCISTKASSGSCPRT